MPTGSIYRTKAEVEAIEDFIKTERGTAHFQALIDDGKLWKVGEVRLDEVLGTIEYWNGSKWTHYLNEPTSKGAALISPTGPTDVVIWEATNPVTVLNVKAYQVGGSTGSTFNARKNGTDQHLSSDGTITALEQWIDGGTVQNTSYLDGDTLEIQVVSVSGSPSQIVVQVEMEYF